MKTIMIGLLALFISSTGYSQLLDCKRFRTGRFTYEGLPGKLSWRKNAVQESYNNGKLEMIWRINWINDCEYEMFCLRVINKAYSIKPGDRILARIISINGDCYTTSSTYYNTEHPNGMKVPDSNMCIKKD